MFVTAAVGEDVIRRSPRKKHVPLATPIERAATKLAGALLMDEGESGRLRREETWCRSRR